MPVCMHLHDTQARRSPAPCGLTHPVNQKEEKVVYMMGQRGTSSRPRTLGAALPWSWVQGSLAVTCGAGRKENGLRGDGGYGC